MKIVQLAYISLPVRDPQEWLKRIDFTVGILDEIARIATIEAIFNIQYKGTFTQKNVTYWFTNFSRWQVLLPFQLNRMVKKLGPDVVLVHGLISPWQVIWLRFTLGSSARIMVQHHAEKPFRDFRKYIQRWADRFVEAYLFASSDLGAMWVNEKQICNAGKIREAMEGSSFFYPMDKQHAKEFTNVKGVTVYLWVGDLTANKDPLLAAHAFMRFAENNPSVNLYMIYQEKHLESDLKKLIQGSKNICLVGQVKHEELLHWYNSADYIISTSHYEGSGIAVCEAMSCGAIPILSNIPSFRMMTSNGECGLLFKCGDENDLVNKLWQSLQLPLEAQHEMVLQKFKSDLSFVAIARKTVEIANEILNNDAR